LLERLRDAGLGDPADRRAVRLSSGQPSGATRRRAERRRPADAAPKPQPPVDTAVAMSASECEFNVAPDHKTFFSCCMSEPLCAAIPG
jgi:hypothetical protein